MRGGILDLYGFGMAGPARLEWWGDDIASIRGFDLTTQRSLQELTEVTALPIDTRSVREELEVGVGAGGSRSEAGATGNGGWPPRLAAGESEAALRRTLLELLPSDTIVIEEAAGPDHDEVQRAWNEAQHHLEVARRLGDDVPGREQILEPPEQWRIRLSAYPRLLLRDELKS